MTYAKQVPAAERVLRLLEVLTGAPAGLSAGELEDTLQISRSSLFALLNTLKARNYIEQSDNRGRYRVGPALYALLPAQHQELSRLIEAFQADPDIGLMTETVALARLDGPETVIIAQQESNRPVRAILRVGQRRPAHTTAEGLVLLAGLPPGAIERSLPQQADGLAATLRRVQTEGLAQTGGEETAEVAAPICPDGYQPTVALLISAPAFRWQPTNNLLQSLRSAAARLSFRLGAPVYQPYGQAAIDPVGPTTALDSDETSEFLNGAWGARLACVRKDGSPHVVPLWYEWDGHCFWVTASPSANWGEYIRENSWVSLTIDEPWPPLRRALIVGHTEPVADETIPGGIAGLRRRLAARYLGRGTAATESSGQCGWQAFKIIPQKIIGQRGLGK